jgi:hypothetical protein
MVLFFGGSSSKTRETGLSSQAFLPSVAAMKIPNLPDWVAPGLGILFLLLGFLMIFFLVQQGYNAIRRRKRNS